MNIAFDLDGTLIGCANRQSAVLQSIVNALAVDCDVQQIWAAKRDGASTEVALIGFGIDSALARQVALQWRYIVEEPYWLSLDSLFAGSKELLKRLKRQGHYLHLLTARSRADLLYLQLAQLGIIDLFDHVDVVTGPKVPEQKAAQLSARSAQIFVGDTESDFQAAGLAGVPFYAVATGQRSASFLRNQGITQIAESLHEAMDRVQQ